MACLDMKVEYQLVLSAGEVRLVVLALNARLEKEEDLVAAARLAAYVQDRRLQSHRESVYALEKPAPMTLSKGK